MYINARNFHAIAAVMETATQLPEEQQHSGGGDIPQSIGPCPLTGTVRPSSEIPKWVMTRPTNMASFRFG